MNGYWNDNPYSLLPLFNKAMRKFMGLFSNSILAWGTAAGLFYFSVIYFNKFLNNLLSYCLLYSFRNIKRPNENNEVRKEGNGFSIS